jgi:NADH:ubiquinone oxidoreductase subunit 3 (subunit A)
MSDTLLLPIAFGVCIAVALFIYWIAGRISAKGSMTGTEKETSYACGEDLPVGELRVDLERLLIFAVYFLIFDVLVFVLATSFNTMGLIPTAYSLIVLMAVAMLILSRRYK